MTDSVSVPKLQIHGTRKKSLREGRRNYYTHKMGAGYKSRCSDTERWQQYLANEYRWASSGTNFSCPFRFISKESYSEENNTEKVRKSSFFVSLLILHTSINLNHCLYRKK